MLYFRFILKRLQTDHGNLLQRKKKEFLKTFPIKSDILSQSQIENTEHAPYSKFLSFSLELYLL